MMRGRVLPPAVTIHSAEQAVRILALGRPVTLLSAPGAAVFAGPGWWRAVIAACETVQPDVLDCADAPGRALEALAAGCGIVVLRDCPAWESVAARAAGAGATVLRKRPVSLDLAGRVPPLRIAAWLGLG